MTIINHSDDGEKDFLNRARQGDYEDDPEMMEAVNKSIDEEQARKNQDKAKISPAQDRKTLKKCSDKIIQSTTRAYPHLVERNELTDARSRSREAYGQNQPTNQDGITSLFLGISPLVLFVSILCLLISPTSGVTSVSLVVTSIVHALVICSGVLVLAAILNENKTQIAGQPFQTNRDGNFGNLFNRFIAFIKRFPIWNVIAVLLSALITIFCIASSQEKLSISLLIGSLTLLSSLAICFGGKGGLSGIRYLYFLMKDMCMSLRIASENLKVWLPRRLHSVETNLQQYINIANQYDAEDRIKLRLPIGPFSKATQAVLREWFERDLFPSPPPEPPTSSISPLPPFPRTPNNSSSEAQLDEAEPLTNAPESVQDEEHFSSPVDRHIRDAESEI